MVWQGEKSEIGEKVTSASNCIRPISVTKRKIFVGFVLNY